MEKSTPGRTTALTTTSPTPGPAPDPSTGSTPGSPTGPTARATGLSAAADVLAVLVFVTVGRSSHAEGLDPAGVLATAVPFLGALAVGWVATRAWRTPTAVRTGALLWAVTVVLGVVLRGLGGEGVPVSFVVVTAIVLGLLLVGWRAAAALVQRRRARAARPRAA